MCEGGQRDLIREASAVEESRHDDAGYVPDLTQLPSQTTNTNTRSTTSENNITEASGPKTELGGQQNKH